MGPESIGNRRTRQIDQNIHRLLANLFQTRDASHLGAAQGRHFFRLATPYRQAVALAQPESAKLASYQSSTAGQQYVHDVFLAWRFTSITSLFL